MQKAKAKDSFDDLLHRLRQIDSNIDAKLECDLPDGRTDSDIPIKPSWLGGDEPSVFIVRKK